MESVELIPDIWSEIFSHLTRKRDFVALTCVSKLHSTMSNKIIYPPNPQRLQIVRYEKILLTLFQVEMLSTITKYLFNFSRSNAFDRQYYFPNIENALTVAIICAIEQAKNTQKETLLILKTVALDQLDKKWYKTIKDRVVSIYSEDSCLQYAKYIWCGIEDSEKARENADLVIVIDLVNKKDKIYDKDLLFTIDEDQTLSSFQYSENMPVIVKHTQHSSIESDYLKGKTLHITYAISLVTDIKLKTVIDIYHVPISFLPSFINEYDNFIVDCDFKNIYSVISEYSTRVKRLYVTNATHICSPFSHTNKIKGLFEGITLSLRPPITNGISYIELCGIKWSIKQFSAYQAYLPVFYTASSTQENIQLFTGVVTSLQGREMSFSFQGDNMKNFKACWLKIDPCEDLYSFPELCESNVNDEYIKMIANLTLCTQNARAKNTYTVDQLKKLADKYFVSKRGKKGEIAQRLLDIA